MLTTEDAVRDHVLETQHAKLSLLPSGIVTGTRLPPIVLLVLN